MVPPGRRRCDRKGGSRWRVGARAGPCFGEQAACHACGTRSGRVRSRYVRCLADTAVAGRPVVIELQVRRFRCRDRTCRQATFAEQVDGLTSGTGGEAPGCRRCCNGWP
ncbi:transposase family protein [Streptomyces ipomoeae]|uniref:transposase family protein n=1 Tax=Streptomyces ipomoeae TaxID=103232 RepID=UPI00114786B7|nr:transposase family protein [Streptomyces ipomoeae]